MSVSDDIVLLLERDTRADTNDSVVFGANATFLRVSGYTDAQILGRAVSDLFLTERATRRP
jgi:hypothetical protein